MPYKYNQSSHRQHKKAKYKVINWTAYTESLHRRSGITIWFSVETIDEWHPAKVPGLRGGSLNYSDVAICCLMLRQVYHLPQQQTERFTRSLIQLMGLDINAPDYNCLSKRSTLLKVPNYSGVLYLLVIYK